MSAVVFYVIWFFVFMITIRMLIIIIEEISEVTINEPETYSEGY